MNFEKEYIKFWSEFGKGKKMVLSSSLNNIVTSRMMSIVYFEEKLYFQTDKLFRKYEQLKGNPHISLCIDNIQIEGKCKEVGKPKENINFCNIYIKNYFQIHLKITLYLKMKDYLKLPQILFNVGFI